jgi:hypothetical protein
VKHSTDYNATVSDLRLGDRFRLERHGAAFRVAHLSYTVDGGTVHLVDETGEPTAYPAYLRCHVVEAGPRCACGRSYDSCEWDCAWPDELEALDRAYWTRSPVSY